MEDFNAIKNQERGLPIGRKAAAKQARTPKVPQGAATTPAAPDTTPRAANNGAELADANPPADPHSSQGATNKAKRRGCGGAPPDEQQDGAEGGEVCIPVP